MTLYIGTGSKCTPKEYLDSFYKLGNLMASLGWTLRNGFNYEADRAFYKGCLLADGSADIISIKDIELSECAAIEERYPLLKTIETIQRKKRASLYYQLLGRNLDRKADVLVCWAKPHKKDHEFEILLYLAQVENIPVVNAAKCHSDHDKIMDRIEAAIGQKV